MTPSLSKFIPVLVASAMLLGCSSSPLDAMLTEATSSHNQLSAIDDAEEETIPFQTSLLQMFSSSIDDLSNAEKVSLILDIRAELLLHQVEVNQLRSDLQTLIPLFRERVTAFKTSGLTLTEEERTWLNGLRLECQAARIDLQGTRGMVQAKLAELRGQYSLDNLDMILDTYLGIQQSMNVRLNSIQTIHEIISEVDAFLQLKLA